MDIAQSFPRLRSDLEARPIDVAGGRYVVDVTDPNSGKTFRLSDVEYFIATSLNGERDIAGLAALARSELGLQASADELENIIGTLAGLGYLDDTALASPGASAGDTAGDGAGAGLSVDDLTLGQAGANLDDGDAGLPAAPDLELGLAGASSMDAPEEATYVAPDLSLGRAGSSRMASGFPGVDEEDVPTTIKDPRLQSSDTRPSDPSIPPRPPTDSIEPTASLKPVATAADDDDPTQLPAPATDFDDEMSVDLTDHMKLGPEAVKEAVRQSQMLQAVDPEEILRKTPPPMPVVQPKPPVDEPPAVAGPAQDEPGPSAPAAPTQASDEISADHLRPTELPSERAHISKPVDIDDDRGDDLGHDRPIGAPAAGPSSSRSGLLVLLLVLVLAGAAAAAYFLNLFDIRTRLGLEPASEVASSVKSTPATVVPKTATPVKLELPSATLTAKEVAPVEVKATQEGVLVSIVASGTEVAEGDEIARFKGGESHVRAIESTTARLTHYEGKLAKAQAGGNQSEIGRAQRKVDEKKAIIEAAQQKLEAFIVRAPMAGAIETSLAANAKVAQDDVIASFKTPPVLVATFTVPEDKKLAQGDEVEVVAKADEKKRAGCQVITVEGQQVTVECPSNENLAAADEVILP